MCCVLLTRSLDNDLSYLQVPLFLRQYVKSVSSVYSTNGNAYTEAYCYIW